MRMMRLLGSLKDNLREETGADLVKGGYSWRVIVRNPRFIYS